MHISDGKYPRIKVTKNKSLPGEYLGPYMSYFSAAQATDYANKLFKLSTCSKIFPRDINKTRPCLNFHINSCMGVCTGKIKYNDYIENVTQAIKFLKGNTSTLIKDLEKEMEKAAENLEFEKAAKLRDKINGINSVKEKQIIMFKTAKEQDAIAIIKGKNDFCFSVIKIRGGRLIDKNDFLIAADEEEEEALSNFLKNYYYQNEDIPPRIYLNKQCIDKELIEKMASEIAKKQVIIYIPEKGENLKIVKTAEQNARETLALKTDKTNKYYDNLEQLQEMLNLKNIPKYIESYDISNLGNDTIVSGMVVFENAVPKKKAYKRFEIKNQLYQDDYSAMRQVLQRRFARYKDSLYQTSKEKGTGFDVLPDLILLDGGSGHVGVIKNLLDEMDIRVPVFGMVKNSKHRTRAISSDGGEIDIAANKSLFAFITKIQDEVHNYSVSYLHKKMENKTLTSTLTDIEGIGKAKANFLLSHFKSIQNIKKASVDEIKKSKMIGEKDANLIYEY
ncbi:MAG: excinuclease ABC subunit UvrC, partial [Oscillospiraceae bacterium]